MTDNENIKNVWKHNLNEEMAKIRNLITRYNYIAMDTEFPGVVCKPIGSFKNATSYAYHQLRSNVDVLNIIQLGISLSDSKGRRPSPISTWQFNFYFNLENEMYSQESIDLLKAANIDFDEHTEKGISVEDFGVLLTTSGLVMSKGIVWLSFHSSYDFAYLIKILTGNFLPETEENFHKFMSALFPKFYDFKYLIKSTNLVRKGLQEISSELGVSREGVAHQAGSDALLTSETFFKSLENLLKAEEIKYMTSKLYGIEYRSER